MQANRHGGGRPRSGRIPPHRDTPCLRTMPRPADAAPARPADRPCLGGRSLPTDPTTAWSEHGPASRPAATWHRATGERESSTCGDPSRVNEREAVQVVGDPWHLPELANLFGFAWRQPFAISSRNAAP